ncbi:UMP kinase [Candidatus Micrarchaeota archaeon]|nr:UMP kinase [Candidatus Micrarchaeota archaeon]
MQILVISLGGSLLYTNSGEFDELHANRLASLFSKISKGSKLAIVAGGGRLAREYANASRKKQNNEFFADREAIKATRENAKKIISLLPKTAYSKVVQSFDEAKSAISKSAIVFSGGMLEGMTTDAVSVLMAEMLSAKTVINLGDTDGIYSADPKKDPSAKKFSVMPHSQLVELASKNDQRRAGTNFVFDLIASKLSARSNIELRFVNGKNLLEVENALLGKKFNGTIVRD